MTAPGTGVTTSVTILLVNGFAGTVSLSLIEQDGSPTEPRITLVPTGIFVRPSGVHR